MKRAGIYRITIDRGEMPAKFYIGQSSAFHKRRSNHLKRLRRGDHCNRLLQSAFNKYGEEALSFELLLVCEPKTDVLSYYEQAVLESYPEESVYNVHRKCVTSSLGVTVGPETRAKLSKANRGRIHSAEARAKISAASKGNTHGLGYRHTKDSKAKISAAHRGNTYNLGRTPSPESRAKMSSAQSSRIRGPRSPETRAKLSAANRGKHPSAETRAKLSASSAMRKPEARARKSAEMKAYWALARNAK